MSPDVSKPAAPPLAQLLDQRLVQCSLAGSKAGRGFGHVGPLSSLGRWFAVAVEMEMATRTPAHKLFYLQGNFGLGLSMLLLCFLMCSPIGSWTP